ncbi:hypothetical protein SVIO_046460 [Streptomyces violaceusniger]|uniref:thioredoxin-dependent peroxiredoxin n=1 Tax=Streptomyces violaceusniger TaxID=68280 RepID=A0A4D4L7N5_STRVO|nr:hypothetical protein SVIO_046460 [Streptomyces violaceusniger]
MIRSGQSVSSLSSPPHGTPDGKLANVGCVPPMPRGAPDHERATAARRHRPAFTLPDADGKQVSLADHAGRKVIVYFYPAALTPGCTKQACDFTDNLEFLSGHGYDVIGISPTSRRSWPSSASRRA